MSKRNNFKRNKNHPNGASSRNHHMRLVTNFWNDRIQRLICDGALATLIASTRETLQEEQQTEQKNQEEDSANERPGPAPKRNNVIQALSNNAQGGFLNSILLASTLNQAINNKQGRRLADKETQTDCQNRFSVQPNQHWAQLKPNFYKTVPQGLTKPFVPRAASVYYTRPIRYSLYRIDYLLLIIVKHILRPKTAIAHFITYIYLPMSNVHKKYFVLFFRKGILTHDVYTIRKRDGLVLFCECFSKSY